MKKQLLIALFAIITLSGFAQIKFEKGYYITNSNERVECLIKNVNWKNNPNEIIYKLNANSKEEVATIDSVKEFGIEDNLKYERHDVDIDKSRGQTSVVTNFREPKFNKGKLFLRVLVDGQAKLFAYSEVNLKRYFYSKDESPVEQLVYKKYLLDNHGNSKLAYNNDYKKELFNNLKCESIDNSDFKKLTYTKSSLLKYFVNYNECQDSSFYVEKNSGVQWNLSAKAGVSFTSLSIGNDEFTSSVKNLDHVEFDNATNFRFGVEIEAIMPFNNNKWSLFTDIGYQSYKGEKKVDYFFTSAYTRTTNILVDYNYIEAPFGVRHYFFLGDKSKLFLEASYVVMINLKSSVKFTEDTVFLPEEIDVNPSNGYAIGFGYKYDNKYSLQMRYYTKTQLFNDYVFWNSDYGNISVILGYTIF